MVDHKDGSSRNLSQTSPGRPVCLVFGPQIAEIDESLFYISRNIDENPEEVQRWIFVDVAADVK
jgi:hypothetical protein